jgi:hypothetical protein
MNKVGSVNIPKIVKNPINKFYKDYGGKNNKMIFIVDFCKKVYLNDIKVELIIGKHNNEIFNIIKKKIFKNILEIEFKIEKVSRRYDHKNFKIKLSSISNNFNPLFSSEIKVLSKKKRKINDTNILENFRNNDKNDSIYSQMKKIKKDINNIKKDISVINENIKYIKKNLNNIFIEKEQSRNLINYNEIFHKTEKCANLKDINENDILWKF